MRISRIIPARLPLLALPFWLLGVTNSSKADVYLSNLDTQWPTGGIGDIHGIAPRGEPYGPYAARFTTGSGSPFFVNAITLEILGTPTDPRWEYLNVEIHEQINDELLASFGNPVVNPKPTQWPDDTKFVDYSPLASLQLNPHTDYSLVLSIATDMPKSVGLLFAHSPEYATPTDWQMYTTISGNPHAYGQFLKFAVDATMIPEPSSAVLLFGGGIMLWGLCLKRIKQRGAGIRGLQEEGRRVLD